MARFALYFGGVSGFCLLQTTMAEGISKEVKIKAASKALTRQLVNLIGIMDPFMMAASLFSEEIIDQSFVEKVRLPGIRSEKAFDVFTAVSGAVKINPDFFAIFCDILDNEPVTKDIAKILKGSVGVKSLINISALCDGDSFKVAHNYTVSL